MAKADDASSTIDWIWLSAALVLAAVPYGSPLAKELLVHWMATGDLPWACEWWKPRDAERLARWEERRRELEGWGHFSPVSVMPSAEYFRGDVQFGMSDRKVDWENNGAREKSTWGAKASGIKVSRKHLLALLLEGPREREEALRPTTPAERRSMEPKAWLDEVREEHPQYGNESKAAYPRRIHSMMQ